ncbi:hypothetical protein V6Z12_A10G105100 [Gossypium hirsutum]
MVGFDLCNIYRGSKSFCYPCGVLESKRQREKKLVSQRKNLRFFPEISENTSPCLTHRCSHQPYQSANRGSMEKVGNGMGIDWIQFGKGSLFPSTHFI